MKTYVVREFGDFSVDDAECFDLATREIKNCIGCFNCWWKTPGVCGHKDIEDYYRGYVNADRVILFVSLENGFFSSRMKRLLDRTIPLFLPYTIFHDGGTWHSKRYPKYPDVTVYYEGTFADEEEKQIFYDYVKYVYTQFYAENIEIYPVSEFGGAR